MTQRLEYIKPLDVGLIFGILYLGLGIMAGLAAYLNELHLPMAPDLSFMLGNLISASSSALTIMIFMALGGFIKGFIGAILFNLIASRTGGVRVRFRTADDIS